MKRIHALGSLNIDLVQKVDRAPLPGETLLGSDLEIHCGGKGANQACAAARLGGKSVLVGCVGKDVFGTRLRSELADSGVDVSGVRSVDRPTGTATIWVYPDGNNSILLAQGANGDVDESIATTAVAGAREGDLLLCQLEVPLEATSLALRLARERGVVTILDPAPARPLDSSLFAHVDILTPNQVEAAILLGWPPDSIRDLADARDAVDALASRGARAIVLKLGEKGCLLFRGENCIELPAHAVRAVDTTAAGDTYNGALAVALAEGGNFISAGRFANAAAAVSVTRAGAMPSIPLRSSVEEFLRSTHT